MLGAERERMCVDPTAQLLRLSRRTRVRLLHMSKSWYLAFCYKLSEKYLPHPLPLCHTH